MKSTARRPLLAPSLLAADWSRLGEEVIAVERGGADWIHLDVMDGHFVPPITFGAKVVETARRVTELPLDVHLMIENPERQVEAFAKAGASCITVHQETCPHLHRIVQLIHDLGARAGVALNPATPVATLTDIIGDIDLVLLMTVNPGWGGQRYIPASTEKIRQAAALIRNAGSQAYLEVDGGISPETAPLVVSAGADVLVAGTFVFGSTDYRAALESLRSA